MKKLLVLAVGALFLSSATFAHTNPNVSVKNNTKDFTLELKYNIPGHKARMLRVGPHGMKDFGSRNVRIHSLTVLKHKTSKPYGQKCTQIERGQTLSGVNIEINSLLKAHALERDLKPIVTCN